MGERLGAEADREQRRPVGNPPPEELVLVVEPGMVVLLADVLVASEDENRVEVAHGLRGRADLPLDELVPFGGDHVAEGLRPNERPMIDGEHAHGRTVSNPSCMLSAVLR